MSLGEGEAPASAATEARPPISRRSGFRPRVPSWRRLLAIACVAGPFVAIFVLNQFYSKLISPALYQNSAELAFHYTPATPDEASASEPASDKAAAAKSEASKIIPDATMFLPARDYSGRVAYAIASAFLVFAALATLFFSSTVVFRFMPRSRRQGRKWLGLFGLVILWIGLACLIAWWFSDVHGRYLVVRDLLNAADEFPGLAPFVVLCHGHPLGTGRLMEMLIFVNTVIALVPIGMLLTALYYLTKPSCEQITADDLIVRRFLLRCLLWLASASFVMGVLCNKALVEWPLTLISADEVLALRPIADSLVLQFGALGSAAIFLAFAPAIVAWLEDVHELPRPHAVAHGRAHDAEGADKLQFAPPAVISAIVATVAPLLASPVADSLKSVLSAVSK